MSEIRFHIGDKVNITIKGATVTGFSSTAGVSRDMEVTYRATLGTHEASLALDSDAVTVERVPDEPKQGDVYRDKHGDLWFARGADDLVCVDTTEMVPELAHELFGPLTLVSRVKDAA